MPEWEKPFGKATLYSRSLPAHRGESTLSLRAPSPWSQHQGSGDRGVPAWRMPCPAHPGVPAPTPHRHAHSLLPVTHLNPGIHSQTFIQLRFR